jgi:hypothetical protein
MKMKSIKNVLLVVASVALLGACSDPSASKADQLRHSYTNCINTSNGETDKLATCQTILESLKKEKAHEAFAKKETVRVIDYQKCLTARKTGDGQSYAEDCGKIWQEIKANNSPSATN